MSNGSMIPVDRMAICLKLDDTRYIVCTKCGAECPVNVDTERGYWRRPCISCIALDSGATKDTSHVAVDFDGTLSEDTYMPPPSGMPAPHFDVHAEIDTKPIKRIVDLIHTLRAAGKEVRILTARTHWEPVHAWLIKHLGFDLPVSNVKGTGMVMLFDDRAVRVAHNCGLICTCFPMTANDPRHLLGGYRAGLPLAPKHTPYSRWVPEAPNHGGLYAVDPDVAQDQRQNSTHDIHSARMFIDKAECEQWCAANPHPVFVAREHGFG